MPINPFSEKSEPVDKSFLDFRSICLSPYKDASVFTKARLLLALSMENEAVSFSFCFHKNCLDNDVRRALANLRRIENQQQKRLLSLIPPTQTHLINSVFIEFLSTQLAATFAQNEIDSYIKSSLNFALSEDFDHLYRFSNLLEMEQGILAEEILDKAIDILPGRECVKQHRFPFDDVKKSIPSNASTLSSKINLQIICAVEQYAMNYYSFAQSLCQTNPSRNLFAEIGILEEQHVTQYTSIPDNGISFFENLLLHEFTECYVYYCLFLEETDKRIKDIYENHFNLELSHVKFANEMLKKYENKDFYSILGEGYFPSEASFERNAHRNIDYISNILKHTIDVTSFLESFVKTEKIPPNYQYFKYNSFVNKISPSDTVIQSKINEFGTDYRFTTE